MEDLVDKAVWDQCLSQLDDDGLVTLKMQQGEIVDYEYRRADRVDVKIRFCEFLIDKAKADLGPFAKYYDLLKTLEIRIAKKRLF